MKEIEIYNKYKKRIKAFEYVEWLIDWDQSTIAPKASSKYRSQQIEVLSEELYKITSDPKYIKTVETLYENRDKLDEYLSRDIVMAYRKLRIVKNVPKKVYIDYQVLLGESTTVWAEAKEKNDFNIFEPVLEKIIAYNRKLVKYLETDKLKGYDILLDLYEEGFTTEKLDSFFELLKQELIPFVVQVTKGNKNKFNKKLTRSIYPREQQKKFAKYLIDVFGYDLERGFLGESLHPFTNGVVNDDIRIAVAYEEDNFTASIFSVIHEMGHAIYRQQIDPKHKSFFVYNGANYGISQSQSRMFENMIGRSFAFWQTHYPKLQELFPKQLKDISVLEFYRYINKVERSLIRTDADELTYSLHIMVRYELEKQLISGKLKVKDLPKKWRLLMMEYVGKRPINDNEGVLQDIHWALGSIGNFPTYAIGNAYAAQIYNAMNNDINIESAIENNNMALINVWLKEHIHKYGQIKTPDELMKIATNESFNPKYYIEYLKRKFGV